MPVSNNEKLKLDNLKSKILIISCLDFEIIQWIYFNIPNLD